MNMTDTAVAFVIGQQIEQQGVVEAEVAQQHVGGSHLQNLPRRQPIENIGNLLTDAQTKDGRFAILTNHALRQHQVGKIDFLYIVVGVSRFHHALLFSVFDHTGKTPRISQVDGIDIIEPL